VTGRLGLPGERTTLWTLLVLGVGTLFVAWLSSQITPAFVSRYFAPVLATVLLLAAWGCARSRLVGLIAILVVVVSAINVDAYGHPNKSNMREVAGEVGPLLRPGDWVISGQPEQVPLAWYYLPAGLKYANPIGPVQDPRHMDWVNALRHLQDANPQATLGALLAKLRPGQRLLFVRPITQGVNNWVSPWTQLIRRRSAQWGAILSSDPQLTQIAWAPHSLTAGCCIDDSAVLYQVK
jgi:mannosyltransferase